MFLKKLMNSMLHWKLNGTNLCSLILIWLKMLKFGKKLQAIRAKSIPIMDGVYFILIMEVKENPNFSMYWKL